MAIIKIRNPAIDLDAAEIPNLDASKITSGTIDTSRISGLPASAISSGTFADARIASSNVSQHATSFDDNKLVNDISTLGLRVHTQENLTASNSNSASFDIFQDASNITNLTNSVRNNLEFVQSGTNSTYTIDTADTIFSNNMTGTVIGNQSSSDGTVITFTDNSSWTNLKDINDASSYIVHSNGGTSTGYALGMKFDLGGEVNITEFYCKRRTTNGEITSYKYEHSTNGTDWTAFDLSSATSSVQARYSTNGANTSGGEISSMTSDGIVNFNVFGAVGGEYGMSYRIQNFTAVDARYIRQTYNYQNSGNSNAGMSIFIPVGEATLVSATGSFEGTDITAPSTVSTMGAVITYEETGTNTLNTDILLDLSSDSGSNFTRATLTALPNFATGIKMAKVNDLSLTGGTGTAVTYKISFANQSSTKRGKIRGVSLQY